MRNTAAGRIRPARRAGHAASATAATGPSTVQRVRDYQRKVSAGASDELPASQGRLTVPLPLRTYAGLAKDIVVIGAYNRLEVWDAARWAEYSAAQEEAFAAMNEEAWGAG